MNATKSIVVSDISVSYDKKEKYECRCCERIIKVAEATFQLGDKRVDFCSKFCLQEYLKYRRAKSNIRH